MKILENLQRKKGKNRIELPDFEIGINLNTHALIY